MKSMCEKVMILLGFCVLLTKILLTRSWSFSMMTSCTEGMESAVFRSIEVGDSWCAIWLYHTFSVVFLLWFLFPNCCAARVIFLSLLITSLPLKTPLPVACVSVLSMVFTFMLKIVVLEFRSLSSRLIGASVCCLLLLYLLMCLFHAEHSHTQISFLSFGVYYQNQVRSGG